MMDTPNLALPLMAAAQAQKHITHNEALAMLDALTQLCVSSRVAASPPAAPAEGARFLVPAGGSGPFAGKAGQIALFDGGLWRFLAPKAGWIAYVADEAAALIHDGAGWAPLGAAIGEMGQLASLGIGTASDAVNRLAVRSQGVLMTANRVAAGGVGDMRLIVEKEAAARSGSLLFQTAYSGRAEMGLMGDDGFRVKVSADGAAWRDAMQVDAGTGKVSFPNGMSAAAGEGAAAAGNVRLELTGGNLRLMPMRGNGLTINGSIASVPLAGVALSAAGLAPGTLYFIYATASAGVVNALVATTTPPATHVDGTQIMAGDPARALVGMAAADAGPAWVDSAAKGLVASWHNRRPRPQQLSAASSAATASGTYVELSPAMRLEWLAWGDEPVEVTVATSGHVGAGAQQGTGIGIDGAANVASDHFHTTPNVATVGNFHSGFVSAGRHDSRLLGRSSGGQTAMFHTMSHRVVTRR
jgi:hypothetical protein